MSPACHDNVAPTIDTVEVTRAVGHHVMAGLPQWALLLALATALAVTVWGLTRGHTWFKQDHRKRLDLTRLPWVHYLLHRRWLQFSFQFPLVLLLGLVLYAGFAGTPVADRNLSTVLTWTLWWTLLIVDIVVLGRMWCFACPWEALAGWTRRLALWRRTSEPLALDLKWPKWARNVYPATFLFLGLTWMELGYGVTMSPRATATLGLAMVVMAIVPALFFERRSFCRYGCLIGRIVGLYSMIAPVEVRARDASICKSCKTKDCLQGNDRGYPCPTGQCLTTMSSNTYCTVCTECFKTCPSDNVALNARPLASDLHSSATPRRDEATLALVLVAMSSFHGFTMTPIWNDMLSGFITEADISRITAFSIMMTGMLVVPLALYLGLAKLAASWGARLRRSLMKPARGYRDAALNYAYPLIAVALMYHLAHNVGHLLMEGAMIVPVISDPLGSGADYFGTAGFSPRMLTSMSVVWVLMVLFVLVGHWWAVRATERAHRRIAKGRASPMPLRARVVASLFPLVVTAFNLWLLAQPMEMRTGM